MPYKEKPIEKMFYTIGEVSNILNVPVSTVRFWDNEFPIIKPSKNKKGNRLFTPTDLKNLKTIHHLLKEEGMTIPGVKKKMAFKKDDVDYKNSIKESLLEIKDMLIAVRDSI